uniref:RNA helicase n=1 Tax=Meloidogyne incognita TaxID=6306 RepID=A0A914LKS3_MELIC
MASKSNRHNIFDTPSTYSCQNEKSSQNFGSEKTNQNNKIDDCSNNNWTNDWSNANSINNFNSANNSQTFLGKIENKRNVGSQRNEFGTFAPRFISENNSNKEKPQTKREKFLPPKAEEWELFDENKQVKEGEMFDEICEVYEEATAVLNCDGTDVQFERIESFDQCSFSAELMLNVQLKKLKKPTPVQRVVIPLITKKKNDLLCHAQTGSGKTAAFLLPIISRLQHFSRKRGFDTNSYTPYAIIVSPTKELVKQLYDDACAFSLRTGVTVSYTFGDIPMKASVAGLTYGCDIFIATCGRLSQFVEEKYISLEELRFLVLDEADKLLKVDNFYSCVKEIKQQKNIYPTHRVLMFSATYEHSINDLVQSFLRDDFVQIQIGQINSAADTVEQTFLKVNKHTLNGINGKQDTLLEFLLKHEKTRLVPQPNGDDYWKVPKTIIFVEQKRLSYRLGLTLNDNNIRASSYNSDLTLKMRYQAVSKFATDQCDVLVATDVGARGLNFPNVQYVINYDLPSRDLRGSQNEYIHRIGRTGRIGNVGAAISYFDPSSINDKRNASYFVKVLQDSRQTVPEWMLEFVEENETSVNNLSKDAFSNYEGEKNFV